MKRHSTHQIDELAQRVFRDVLPPSWVPNEHDNDYGKDYLIETGDDSGELTGRSFYVQLKGHTRAEVSADRTMVRHSLESKYARYYVDKIHDLPVFLVVVDVTKKKGWWLFLQEALAPDESWRKQSSVTVNLPIVNDLTDTNALRRAVEDAKKWMRLRHPEAIQDAVVAHKERIRKADPRFDVKVSLENDQPKFTLLPKEEVHLHLEFVGEIDSIREKVNKLFDKGVPVAFEAGELRITGSKLFERAEEVACQMQIAVTLNATMRIVCGDENGKELARIDGIPGRFTGGTKELFFEGELPDSPLSVDLGPVAPDAGGCFGIKLNVQRWSGQRMLQLAYFDRLQQFFRAMPKARSVRVECEEHGNLIFALAKSLEHQPYAIPVASYLNSVEKGRRICRRFNVNPTWTAKSFDRDAQETFDRLDAILFGQGFTRPMPNLRVSMTCVGRTMSPLLKSGVPGHYMIVAERTFTFMGEKVKVGPLEHEFRDAVPRLKEEASKQLKPNGPRRGSNGRKGNRTIELLLLGTPSTIVSMRTATTERPSISGDREGNGANESGHTQNCR